ncbi:MAG: IS30 family transposase [Candidatus Omnitrophota bacterium]
MSYELSNKRRRGRRYDANYAQHKTRVNQNYRRIRPNTIVEHPELQKTVDSYLMDDQSPEHISRRIAKYHKNLPYVSGITIRIYIKSPYGRRIEVHRNKLSKRKGGRRKRWQRITDKRMIDKRPSIINAKKRDGDMEGDFIAPGKDGEGLLLIHTDRKLRYPLLEKIHPVSIRTLTNAIKRIKKRYPEMKTVTWDNDILLICHKELEKKFDIKIYFCHPYKFWEKGGVENRNKIIRKYIPKGSDISRYSRAYIKKLEEKLQRRIMKCLRYRTPAEVLETHRKRKEKP